jgi:2-amino-4-hydroxy-6-hydroxymethyldihydropteridine diphosphokinase
MTERAVPVAIALGSNAGDRAGHIAEAVRRLPDSGITVERISSLYETEPIGWPRDGTRPSWFLNAVLVGRTELRPHVLLARLQRLEEALGRVRGEGLQPRPIDLDIVLYGARIVRSPTLTLPHPGFRERTFVLVPLREIAPDWVDPVTRRSVRELAELLGDRHAGLRVHGPAPEVPS